MATIFINYRRQDSRGITFSLREKLLKYFDDDELFLDIEGLDAGQDFVKGLEKTVSLADVMLVMIGHDWLNITDSNGVRRLDKEDDFVRVEIASAIAQGKKILPVLIEGAQMPLASDLPDDLKDLTRRNAADLRLSRINDDAKAIAMDLKKLIPAKTWSSQHVFGFSAAAAAVALIAGILAGPSLINGVLQQDWGLDDFKAGHQAEISTLNANHMAELATLQQKTTRLTEELANANSQVLAKSAEISTLAKRNQVALTDLQKKLEATKGSSEARLQLIIALNNDIKDLNRQMEIKDNLYEAARNERNNNAEVITKTREELNALRQEMVSFNKEDVGDELHLALVHKNEAPSDCTFVSKVRTSGFLFPGILVALRASKKIDGACPVNQ